MSRLMSRKEAKSYMDELNALNKKYGVSITHVNELMLTISVHHDGDYYDIYSGDEDTGWTFSHLWPG